MTEPDASLLASELRAVLGTLVRRMRSDNRIPLAHGAVLARLDRDGPASASELAAAERVRPQSMAQTLSDLEQDGLIARGPHPTDRRRALVTLTAQGRDTLAAERARREGWLERAIDEQLPPNEVRALAKALAVLRKLAER